MELSDIPDLNLPEKEEKILKAAIKVFSEKGFSAATTSEIARNAGVAEGTIFRYFKTKKDLLHGILIHTLRLVSGKLVLEGVERIFKESDGKDLRAVLKELLRDRLKLVDSFFPMARVVFSEAMFHEDVREAIYQNIVLKALDIFGAFHAKMAARGLIRPDIRPEVLVRTILGNLAAMVVQRKFFEDKFPMEDMDVEIDRMLDVLLFGIAPDAKSKPLEVAYE